ncbi:GNAT family N-acetyltransferase [Nodosilinea sp. LEGE 07088]|uniref:GNAT family N-acetyltransferase n=1 Tax=Nodosilinea sp. LEGE 07088 TaxID=2777968 RepID=UPI00187E10DA|nr:GNAT family N-acetyltransferase [Nodosilinea sp. LEGE 07088]MBE9139091.1 GNAT family N-acetyltransferase [Nodosilinea sp. LEGE 07088]
MDSTAIRFRVGTPEDDEVIAGHFYRLWQDLEVSEADIQPDWRPICLEFITQARRSLYYQAVIAEIDRVVVGSVSGQLFDGLYPAVLAPQYRQYGYIWGVYVEPAYRQRGIATQLTRQMVDSLKRLGCTKVVLNAAPAARSLYVRLGFGDSNLMELDLTPPE